MSGYLGSSPVEKGNDRINLKIGKDSNLLKLNAGSKVSYGWVQKMKRQEASGI